MCVSATRNTCSRNTAAYRGSHIACKCDLKQQENCMQDCIYFCHRSTHNYNGNTHVTVQNRQNNKAALNCT